MLKKRKATAVDVFSAFPKAVVKNVWQIGEWVSDTRTGNEFKSIGYIDVIEDEAGDMSFGSAPNAEVLTSDILLYVRPEQLPTTNINALKTAYMLCSQVTGDYYVIVNAGAGKNQENGKIEHIELLLRQTEAEDVK